MCSIPVGEGAKRVTTELGKRVLQELYLV
jgi:hypothetical protein